MKKYTIEYSNEAKNDIISIKKYIKFNLLEPEVADRIILKIKTEIEKIKINPEKYMIMDDEQIRKLEIRKILVKNYIVFYRINNTSIQIVRILYARRNWIDLIK